MPQLVFPIQRQIWPLVVIGTGSSAAYYMCTVDLGLYPHVLGIGQGDPWAGARGHVEWDPLDPTRNINHPLHLIAHFRDTVPGFAETLVDRLEWARMNAAVLDKCNVQTVDAKVRSVEECAQFPDDLAVEGIDPPPTDFKITLENQEPIYAYKVVMAAGTGGHRVPGDRDCRGCDATRKLRPMQVVNLDEFAHYGSARLGPATTVMVLGSNAAIDAVQKAIFYGCQLTWVFSSTTKTDELPILASQPTVRAWTDANKDDPSRLIRYKSISCAVSGVKIAVTITPDGANAQPVTQSVNYLVFGLGPTGDTVKMISSSIQEKLKPIWDKNQAVSSGDAILGFEAEGTGLLNGFEVIGALCASVARDLGKSESHKERIKERLDITRSDFDLWMRLITCDLLPTALLVMDPDDLVAVKRDGLYKQLCEEKNKVLHFYLHTPQHPVLVNKLHCLVNELTAYYAAHYYKDLMNLAAQTQSQGMVADAGQLMAINAAMAGKHATTPSYLGKQTFTSPGPRPEGHPDRGKWVEVTQTAGEVNFNQDNPSMLFIGLTIRYPEIPHDELSRWIAGLMDKREKSGRGFDEQTIRGFYMELDSKNNVVVRSMLSPDDASQKPLEK